MRLAGRVACRRKEGFSMIVRSRPDLSRAVLNDVVMFQIAPNCSLRPRSAALFFASICAVSFGIAGTLALFGMWPILPFAGLEMLVLGWALRVSLRRRHHSQTILVTDDLVRIETRSRER